MPLGPLAVMSRDFIHNHSTDHPLDDDQLLQIRKQVLHRHIAWLHALTIELRKPRTWEHHGPRENLKGDN